MSRSITKSGAALLATAVAMTLSLSACYSHAERSDTVNSNVATIRTPSGDTVIVATAAPPALREEAPPSSPGENYVWISGYWNWSNGAYSWQPGHYEAQRTGYAWVPTAWMQTSAGWRMTPGHWEAVAQ